MVNIEVEVNPTEDLEKVKRAVENIFGPIRTQVEPLEQGELLVAENKGIDGLRILHDLLERYRIRDAARTVLYKGLSDNAIIFHLNKQVAYVGHLSFSNPAGESPLGPIRVQIYCDKPRELIDWLTPKTSR